MSAAAPLATECRSIEIEYRIKAFREPDGNIQFRYYNEAGDYILY